MYFNNSVSTEEIRPPRLVIFPDPSQGMLSMETTAHGPFSITDLNGRELITGRVNGPRTQIDVSSLPSGIYFIRLTSNTAIVTGKFVRL